jgi:hypothetical protein
MQSRRSQRGFDYWQPAFGNRPLRSPLLVGVAISVALAVILALVTSTTVLLGVCIGLLGTVLALVYDLLRRFEHRIEVEDQRSVLMAAVDDTPWLLADLREIATNAKSVLARDRSALLFIDLMRAELGDTRAFLQDLNRGQIRVPAGDATPMANQIDLVQESVLATTIPECDNSWWLSPAGKDYLDRNRRAIRERGVKIERVVLWEQSSPELARIVEEQQEAGVRLLFVQRNTLSEGLKTSMAIYDGVIYHDIVFNADGEDIYYEYYLDASDVKGAVSRFNTLKRVATEEPPPEIFRWDEVPAPPIALAKDGDPGTGRAS